MIRPKNITTTTENQSKLNLKKIRSSKQYTTRLTVIKRKRKTHPKGGDKITLLVTGTFVDGMTLSTLSPKDLLSGFRIARWCFCERRHFFWFC
jgi:hypothetical protein